MSVLLSAIRIGTAILGFWANDDNDLDLAAALARRGWIELAEEICGRIEKSPGASVSAKAGVPLVLAEVSVFRARREADVLQAAKELEIAVERLNRPNHAPTLDERGMTGWLHVQKAKLLSAAAEEEAARRPDAVKAWEGVEAFLRASLAELEKLPTGRAVDEAMLDARLEIPKAMAAQARILPLEDARRKKLLEESIRLFSDFQFLLSSQPVLLEAQLEEGRSRADLGDHARAERCFRSLPGMARDLRKKGFPASEYMTSMLQGGVLSLVRTLTQAAKLKEAAATCEEFLRDNPKLLRAPIGQAITLAKADALYALKDEAGAIGLAQGVAKQDPDGAAGRMARDKVRKWMTGVNATPERAMMVADGLIDRGQIREALVDLRRCVELCATPADRAKYEPVASYKRGECFRVLKQDAEASVAFQEVFRKYPAHELARRAAFEAVRSLSRSSGASGDRRDEEQMERLLDEVEKLGLQGTDGGYLKFIRAEILERKGQFRASADLYRDVDEGCEVFGEALVSAGHCYRRDAELKWEKGRAAPALRDEVAKELGSAEQALRRALARLEANPAPKLLVVAYYELASVCLHESVGRTKESLGYLDKCSRLLPPESEMLPRLSELEISALLSSRDFEAASSKLEKLLLASPGTPAAARSARRVAARLEASNPAQAGRYYRAWLDCMETLTPTQAELQAAADGLYQIARALNNFDDRIRSVTDLKGKTVQDRGAWKDAARAHEMLIQSGGLTAKDGVVALTRLATSAAFMADSAADWMKAKTACEKLIQDHKLLAKDGTLNVNVLQADSWLAGTYFEYGHSLYQLGKAGQKFQYGNALTAFNNLVGVAGRDSEPWWIAKYMVIRILYERGTGDDLVVAGSALSLLEGNNPDFDKGKFGMKDRLVELRDQIRAVLKPQR
jgi:tetratricopeptide (TPR) repeat protein